MCVLFPEAPKRHRVLFTLRKVRQSPLLSCIFRLPAEAFCDGYKHLSSAHSLPLRERTTKRGVGQQLSGIEPPCHYSDKKDGA